MNIVAALKILINYIQIILSFFKPSFYFLSNKCFDFFLKFGNVQLFGTNVRLSISKVRADSIKSF